MDVAGTTSIVTGGGSGIGRAAALLLAEKGSSVFLIDVDGPGMAETEALIAAAGGKSAAAEADVSDPEALRGALEAGRDWAGFVSVLVNNAGIATPRPGWLEVPPEDWSKVIDVDLSAVIHGTQIAAELMRDTGGVVINTASMAGLYAWPGDPVYSAAKAGVVFFTRAAAEWMEPLRIRVNCVCPGVVDTPLVRRGVESSEDDEIRRRFETITLIQPRQVAEGMLTLIEDDTLTGQAMTILFEGNEIAQVPGIATAQLFGSTSE
ncbi:MAG: SDR family NAD(P)-dependent oxidoreductase [Dehalococcoidia bacterium]